MNARIKTISTGLAIVMALAVAPRLPAQSQGLPAGWIRAGSNPNDYEMGIDPKMSRAGKTSAFIKGKGTTPAGFGTLMQIFDAQQYRGKRVRLSGWVKAQGIAAWAGLWMRVDGTSGSRPLAFDNMQSRPIKGTQDWKSYQVVLDVAPEATAIAFGILLEGSGEAWVNDLHFDVVGAEVTATSNQTLPPRPLNLDFEK